jgi:tetratricopeptide (TPR) repeat protein
VVLRRQIGQVRYQSADRLRLAALSRLIRRRRWGEAFMVAPAAPVLEPDALSEARQLAESLDDTGDVQARYLLGWLHWCRYQALQRSDDLDVAIGMFAVPFTAGVTDLPAQLLPVLAEYAAPVAFALLQQALGSADQGLLSAAAELWLQIVSSAPAGHPDRAVYLNGLGHALLARSQWAGLADLDAAIEALQAASDIASPHDLNQAAYLNNLGRALLARFRHMGVLADADAAVQALKTALRTARPGQPERVMMLANLGNALRIRSGHTGVLADLHAGVQALAAAVDATRPP